MPDHPEPEALRKQERALLLELLLTVFASLPLLAIAVLSDSVLLLGELIDYGRAIATSLIGWSILHAIRTRRVTGYDYGTGKLETLGGLISSSIYLAALILLLVETLERLFDPVELEYAFVGFGVLYLMGGFVVDSWLWWRNRRLAGLNYSPVMEAQWRANRTDALTTLAVILGLGGALVFQSSTVSAYIDAICTLGFTIYSGVEFLSRMGGGLRELLDKTLNEDLQLRIDRCLAENFAGYTEFHGVRTRRAGGRIFIEIGLSFAPDWTVAEALLTVERLKSGIEAEVPGSEVSVVLQSSVPVQGRVAVGDCSLTAPTAPDMRVSASGS